jgi:hypothetical protein
VAEVQIGCGGVKSSLDAQRPANFEPLPEFSLDQQFVTATPDNFELGFRRGHSVQYFTMRNLMFAIQADSVKLPAAKNSGKSCSKLKA